MPRYSRHVFGLLAELRKNSKVTLGVGGNKKAKPEQKRIRKQTSFPPKKIITKRAFKKLDSLPISRQEKLVLKEVLKYIVKNPLAAKGDIYSLGPGPFRGKNISILVKRAETKGGPFEQLVPVSSGLVQRLIGIAFKEGIIEEVK